MSRGEDNALQLHIENFQKNFANFFIEVRKLMGSIRLFLNETTKEASHALARSTSPLNEPASQQKEDGTKSKRLALRFCSFGVPTEKLAKDAVKLSDCVSKLLEEVKRKKQQTIPAKRILYGATKPPPSPGKWRIFSDDPTLRTFNQRRGKKRSREGVPLVVKNRYTVSSTGTGDKSSKENSLMMHSPGVSCTSMQKELNLLDRLRQQVINDLAAIRDVLKIASEHFQSGNPEWQDALKTALGRRNTF